MDDSKVAVILEDLRSQFRVFGEGLQILNEKVDRVDKKVDTLETKVDSLETKVDSLDKKVDALDNRLERHELKDQEEHRLLMQMIRELSDEQQKLKRAK
jgi:phage shock protein A